MSEKIKAPAELKRLIKLLRKRLDSPDFNDIKSRKIVASIIVELRGIENEEIEKPHFQLTKNVTEMLTLWQNDPVIKAYVNQKEDWEMRLSEVEDSDL